MWTTWGTVEEFDYINPHPAIKFARTDKNGNVEHWAAEMANNPSRLARVGWTKSRSNAALAVGNKVKFYVATSIAGGHLAYVELIENDNGRIYLQRAGKKRRRPKIWTVFRTAINHPSRTRSK